ncbi:uncharacterized protein LOC144581368 [Callithrix jacchus]
MTSSEMTSSPPQRSESGFRPERISPNSKDAGSPRHHQVTCKVDSLSGSWMDNTHPSPCLITALSVRAHYSASGFSMWAPLTHFCILLPDLYSALDYAFEPAKILKNPTKPYPIAACPIRP